MVDRVGLRRAFGTTRKHRSGRWGAEYTHPISRERVLPGHSFRTKADALKWLATAEVDLDRGQLLDPSGTKQTFESYATTWLAGRNDLRPKTLSLYDYLLRVHRRCCVERSRGAAHRCGLVLRSDRFSEFIESGRHT